MKLIYDLSVAIVGGIGTTFLMWIGTKVYFGWTSFPGIKRSFRILREYTRAGGVNFFSSRKSYVQFKDHGHQSDYLRRNAKGSIIYVGFWLAHGVEISNVTDTLKQLLENKITVTIVLIDPDSAVLEPCSKFLGLSSEEVKSRVNSALVKFATLRAELSSDAKSRFAVKLHSIPISASAFLLDSEREVDGRTLLDVKLYGFSRDQSFGMEFRTKGKPLYDNVTESYLKIVASARTCPF